MLAGLGTLLALRLRRDRLTLVLWTVGLALLWTVSATAVGSTFDDAARRELVALLVSNPALLLMRGAPSGVGFGAVLFASVYNYVALLVAVMASFIAVRHTRADSDAGRAELVAAGVVGRLSPVVSALLAGTIEVAVVAAGIGAGSLAVGLDPGGAALTAAGTFAIGLTFLALGTIAGQAAPTARAANGLGAAAAGLAFVVRGLADAFGTVSGDATRVTPTVLSWFSPLGWMTHVWPFADLPWRPDPQPLLLYLPLLVLLVGVVLGVELRRELGASLLRERDGAAHGSPALGTASGLAIRLQRGAALGWVVAAGLLGLFVGLIAPAVSETLLANDTIAQMLEALGGASTHDMVATLLVALGGIVAVLASAAALQAVVRLRHEELRLGETLLATSISRTRWAGTWLLVAGVVGLLVVAAFALASGLTLALGDTGPRWGDALRIAGTMSPVVLVYLALGALLFAALPRSLAVLGWPLLLGPMLAGEFGPLLGEDLDWVASISPFQWLPDPLADDVDLAPIVLMVVGSLLAIVLALVRIRRRDVTI